MMTEIISLIVVMNGPLATAGSIFNLYINKGNNAPAIVATNNDTVIDAPTINPKYKLLSNGEPTIILQITTIANTMIPQVTPVIIPVSDSRLNRL